MSQSLTPYRLKVPAGQPPRTVDAARKFLEDIKAGIHHLNAASVILRFVFGAGLVAIRDEGLFHELRSKEHPDDPVTFDSWLRGAFRDLTGFGRETAYVAIRMSRSPVLLGMSQQEMREFRCLSNVIDIVNHEKHGGKIDAQLLEQAKELPIREFRRSLGIPEDKSRVEIIVDKTDSGVMEEVIGFLAALEVEQLERLLEYIAYFSLPDLHPQEAMERILSACYHNCVNPDGLNAEEPTRQDDVDTLVQLENTDSPLINTEEVNSAWE
jgi:hypothetical protein